MSSRSQNDFLIFEKFYNGIARANIQPFLLIKIPVCPQKSFFNSVVLPGQICTFIPRQWHQFVSTQNVPQVVKGKSQGNSKTTFRKKLAFLSREGSLRYRFNKARNICQHSKIIKMVETIHKTIGHGVTYR